MYTTNIHVYCLDHRGSVVNKCNDVSINNLKKYIDLYIYLCLYITTLVNNRAPMV